MAPIDSEKLRFAAAAMMLSRRKEARLTQVTVAEESGLARSYISELENGKYVPTVDALFSAGDCIWRFAKRIDRRNRATSTSHER
ncbi:MAG: helix-turn-helix transcriptional regulator [Akkermansiaceae bacterium]|nr:helix-turn-helix transcriptional regulator [Akkermansiaceae bacterium]